MEIEWDGRPNFERSGATTWFARIGRPSNLRWSKYGTTIAAAAYTLHDDGTYSTAFMRSIKQHFDIPHVALKTEKGARRRIRKYIELWAIAGYPTGE